MPPKAKTEPKTFGRMSWRDYQAELKWSTTKKRFINNFLKVFTVGFLLVLVIYTIIDGTGKRSFPHFLTDVFSSSDVKTIDPDRIHDDLLDKKRVQAFLDSASFINLKEKSFNFLSEGHEFIVDTSLDPSLQNFLLKKLNRSTSRYIGIVGIDPNTGQILCMISFDKTDSSNNTCIDNRFPAASIFKIVTASAAVEKCGLNPRSKFTYNGQKHTLYKSQLKDRTNRYTNRTTFKDSFAQSINPVFGKIGLLYLGKDALEAYSDAFGFNRSIDFEIEVAPSEVSLTDEPYQWAEVASGFNQETKISPLHGALMASVIINKGKLMEPTIVNRVVDEDGKIIYRNQRASINQAIAPGTSKILNQLMATTISSGTGRKAFRGYRRDKILSKLNIGGKTGSIDNESHDARYDWFVGFAEGKGGREKIALSVIVAHEKYIGLRASYYARIAMKHYFKNCFRQKKNSDTQTGQTG